jgi:hypothetical protein
MSKWIAKLFEPKHNSNDIVRFVRTEYRKDTEHLHDVDVIAYYNNLMSKKRRA